MFPVEMYIISNRGDAIKVSFRAKKQTTEAWSEELMKDDFRIVATFRLVQGDHVLENAMVRYSDVVYLW